MAVPSKGAGGASSPSLQQKSPLVKRSPISPGKSYHDYREALRYDFYHSCAYCTMTECEAQAIRFTIDHYEPQVRAPALAHDYSNLMWCCDTCNTFKGDRWPPASAQAQGYRYFRPDQDIHGDHFERDGLRLKTKTPAGYYTAQSLNLDRLALRRVRQARQKLSDCDQLVVEGINALKNFPLDQLPQDVKGNAARAIRQMTAYATGFAEGIDKILREHARSPLLDTDPEAEEESIKRAANLEELEGMYPGSWRARPRKKPKSSRKRRSTLKKKRSR